MKRHEESADPIALSREFDSLAQAVLRAVACLDDWEASRQPAAGEWSVKQILAHLLGPAPHGYVGGVRRVLKNEQPRLALDPGLAQYSEARLGLRTAQLGSLVAHEYQRLADLCSVLSRRELNSSIRVEELAHSATDPSLAAFLSAVLDHLAAHVHQIEATRRRTACAPLSPERPTTLSVEDAPSRERPKIA